MGSAGRPNEAGDLPEGRRTPPRRRPARRRAARQPPGGLTAPQGAEGRAAGCRRARRESPDLPDRPSRAAHAARRPRGVLGQDTGGLQAGRGEIDGGGPMSTQAAETSIRTSVMVEVPIDRAFRVFTEDFDRIKPRDHNMLEVDIAESVFEPRAGGRVYDRGVDGTECQWARVLAYEPPSRIVFTWDISPAWHLEPNLAKTSEVEVRFIAETDERTRVELEHRHLDRHLDGWESL